MVDVFGGVKGDEKATINPFAIDRENALKQLRLAIDVFEGRRVKKKSILQSMRDGTYGSRRKNLQIGNIIKLMRKNLI